MLRSWLAFVAPSNEALDGPWLLPPDRSAAYKARVLHAAWALAGALVLAPGEGPAPSAQLGASDRESVEQGPARLVFDEQYRGQLRIVDAQGQIVASVVLRGEGPTLVEVPPGRYTLEDRAGEPIGSVDVEADQVRAVALPPSWRSAPDDPVATVPARPAAAVTTAPLRSPTVEGSAGVELVRRRRWARWAAPLLSAVAPGGGQALNGQPGRGLAVFTGTVGLVLGTVAVWAARDPAAGATPTDPDAGTREAVRLGALGGLSMAAGLLYVGQILDAHARSRDRGPAPRTGHRVSLELSRYSTVGFAAGEPAYDLYNDWSLAIMGQLVPRVTLGVSDLSIKYGRERSRVTVQGGVRAAYRFFDRRRVWLGAGGGVLLQGTRADPSLSPLDDEAERGPSVEPQRGFSTVPYVHGDARLFLLDRWSLGLVPRLSVPLWPRRYRGEQALPRYAATFELGATMGVYF